MDRSRALTAADVALRVLAICPGQKLTFIWIFGERVDLAGRSGSDCFEEAVHERHSD